MRVVFDLDGTLADCSHRLHHLERKSLESWDAFFAACPLDAPIEKVIAIARALHAAGHVLEIWTGRNAAVRAETQFWLAENGIPTTLLLMRNIGDHRNDDVLKREWLDAAATEGLPIDLVFEDRQRLVDMYRGAGVTCLQVASGNF